MSSSICGLNIIVFKDEYDEKNADNEAITRLGKSDYVIDYYSFFQTCGIIGECSDSLLEIVVDDIGLDYVLEPYEKELIEYCDLNFPNCKKPNKRLNKNTDTKTEYDYLSIATVWRCECGCYETDGSYDCDSEEELLGFVDFENVIPL